MPGPGQVKQQAVAAEVASYVQQNGIRPMFTQMMVAILHDRPVNPYLYIQEWAKNNNPEQGTKKYAKARVLSLTYGMRVAVDMLCLFFTSCCVSSLVLFRGAIRHGGRWYGRPKRRTTSDE